MNAHRKVSQRNFLAAILFLSFIHPSSALPISQSIPTFIFGAWRVCRFVEVGAHTAESTELPQKLVGSVFRFDKNSFTYDRNFPLGAHEKCSRVKYRFEIRQLKEYEAGQRGTLEFHGLEAEKKRQIRRVVVICSGRPVYYFELSKANQLAIYFDGWFFFLEKSTDSSIIK